MTKALEHADQIMACKPGEGGGMSVYPEYDTRPLIDMLAEQRSRDEKEAILRAIKTLRRDDEATRKEIDHIAGHDEAAVIGGEG